MTELLDQLRGAGIAMGTRYAPTSFTGPETKEDHASQMHVGYTTDSVKADNARKMGVTVTSCGGTIAAWEVSVRVIDP